QHFLVSANAHAYNPGHLLLFPLRHVVTLGELTEDEALELHRLQVDSFGVLRGLYGAVSFNVGLNLGPASGASIEHLHLHVVPRYDRELGFMDIIGGAKIMVEDPTQSRDRLHTAFLELSTGKSE
ncbi:MAG: HIT domain-containing protein, partial [Candidatus Riflebacteria bacterium]|nr:HIT domain-containing protein [Candidatus Riflebacteria bacterium]